VTPHAVRKSFPSLLIQTTGAELLHKIPVTAVDFIDMLSEQAKYSNPSINKADCGQYNVGLVAKIGAGRTGNSSSIAVGGKRFVIPGRKLSDRKWDPSLLCEWKGRLFTWGYSGQSVKLIIHLHLVLRIKTYVATRTSALPMCHHGVHEGQLHTHPSLDAGTRFQDPCDKRKSANN
jgi:hypothetical protein